MGDVGRDEPDPRRHGHLGEQLGLERGSARDRFSAGCARGRSRAEAYERRVGRVRARHRLIALEDALFAARSDLVLGSFHGRGARARRRLPERERAARTVQLRSRGRRPNGPRDERRLGRVLDRPDRRAALRARTYGRDHPDGALRDARGNVCTRRRRPRPLAEPGHRAGPDGVRAGRRGRGRARRRVTDAGQPVHAGERGVGVRSARRVHLRSLRRRRGGLGCRPAGGGSQSRSGEPMGVHRRAPRSGPEGDRECAHGLLHCGRLRRHGRDDATRVLRGAQHPGEHAP